MIRRIWPVVFGLLVLCGSLAGAQVTPGLTGDYWENTTTPNPAPSPPAAPAGPITRTQLQTVIDFNDQPNNTPPAPELAWICTPVDNFFARWTGFVRGPVTGTVTFETYSDDGVELRVNNNAIITNWTFHSPTANTGTFAMVLDGWYPIQILFFEGTGGARMRLRWSYAGQALQVVPSTHLSATQPPPPATPTITALQAPGGATAVDVSWTSSGTGVTYDLERSDAGGAFATLQTGMTGLTYQDTGLSYGVDYCYQVRAVQGNLMSAYSTPACLILQPPPPRTNNHTEGVFDDNCACGSSIGAAPGGLFALLLGLAFVGRRRPR